MKKIISIILALSLISTFCVFGTSCQKELTKNITEDNIKDYLGFEVTYSDFNLTKGEQTSSTIFYEYTMSCCMHIKTFPLYEGLNFKNVTITYSETSSFVSSGQVVKILIRPDGTSEATIFLSKTLSSRSELLAFKSFPNSSVETENFSVKEAKGTVVITKQK